MRIACCLLTLAVLSAAVRGEPPSAGRAKPPKVMAATFGACRWGKVEGRTLSIWSYACGRDAGDVRLVPADDVGGFALVSTEPASWRVVIRTFAKPRTARVAAILPAVLAVTGGHEDSCRLVEHRAYGVWGTVWLLEPTGADKRAYDAANAVEPQDNPCGEMGIGPAGDRFFRPLPGDPTRMVYADMGSEIQVFDLATLAVRK